jgi:hypothetical protein
MSAANTPGKLMPRILRMPPKEVLPDGPRRAFVEELFVHYREAGRPPLRQVAMWIKNNEDLKGTASSETIRKVLAGAVVPRAWFTVEAILEAFAALADRNLEEMRWPEDNWSEVTLRGELKKRWNAVLDDYEGDVPALPPKPSPPPAPPSNFDDPWAQAAPPRKFDEEPPF